MTHAPRSLLVLFALACLALPACIVEDIRDGIVVSNSEIARVDASIEASNREVARANELLESLDQQLAALRETNETLVALREDLAVLATIATSLNKLDKHLASLRGTIDNIDSTIPFLKFSEPEPEDEEEEEAVSEEGTPSGEGAAPTTGSVETPK